MRLEEIADLKKNQVPILASFLAQMLRSHSLPITILKVTKMLPSNINICILKIIIYLLEC